jgi:hypothetical protein
VESKKRRLLLVVAHKETDERFLWSPIRNDRVVPEGYYKVTQSMPLDEKRYGHLEIMGKY